MASSNGSTSFDPLAFYSRLSEREAYDQRIADQQRQIDDLKQASAAVYNARNVILELRERLDRVERARLGGPS